MLRSKQWVLLVLGVVVSACTQVTQQPPVVEPTNVAPTLMQSVSTPSATLEPTPVPAPDQVVGCQEQEGRLIQTELVDSNLPRSLPYRVYIPPCAEDAHGQLPTLYLLHGLARTDAQWDELNVDELAQELVVGNRAPPFLIVMPWERLGLDYEQTIVDFLVPHIEAEYGGSPERDLRSIGGISRGAGWALRIGMQHPELFQAIGLHSPAVLVPDIFMLPGWIEDVPEDMVPELWIDMGDRDSLRFELPELTTLLDEGGVKYVRQSFPGEHTETYWGAHVEDYLRWYVSGWLDRELGDQAQ